MNNSPRIWAMVLLAASLSAGPRLVLADADTQRAIDDFKTTCEQNQEGCSSFFGSIFATLSSPVYFLAGLLSSDPDLSVEPFNNMLAKDFARARPEAAEFVQNDGSGQKSALLAETMERMRAAGPMYAQMSDVQLARLIVFGNIPSGS